MRELKFRAWDVTNKKMLDRVLAGPGDPCSIVWNEDRKEWLHFDEACGTIMQFTGLKDSQGKEIYEGDIIKGSYDYGSFGNPVEAVTYENGTWNYSYALQDTGEHSERDWEVIGNIYEHEELIPTKEEKL